MSALVGSRPWRIERIALAFLLLAALAAGIALAGSSPVRSRIAILMPEDPISGPYREATDELARALHEQDRDTERWRLPRLLDQHESFRRGLIDSNPDLVIAVGSNALACLEGTPLRCPAVYTMVLNPRRLTRNEAMSGVVLDVPPATVAATYRSLFPAHARIGAVFSPEHSKDLVHDLDAACAAVGLELRARVAATREDALRTQRVVASEVDGFIVIADPVAASQEVVDGLLELLVPLGKPVIGLKSSDVQKGAAFAFLLDYVAIGRQTALLADRILRDPKPAVEAPSGLSLCVNRAVLERLKVVEPYHVALPIKQVFPPR